MIALMFIIHTYKNLNKKTDFYLMKEILNV